MPINPTLLADTLAVCETPDAYVRLMNDNRWPWFVVLPRDSDATELHHLKDAQRHGYLELVNVISHTLQQHTGCQSVNVAMLGNVVSALHCHVVARNEGDPNWPRPVWGFEQPMVYGTDLPDALIQAVQASTGQS